MTASKDLQDHQYEKPSQGAHTPGPWHVGHFADDTSSCNCTGIVSECYAGAVANIIIDNGLPISNGGNDAPPLREAKANARLIAAAPDMLAALKHCVIDRDEWLAEARAAIARAEGSKP